MLNKFFRYSSKLAALIAVSCLLAGAAYARDPSHADPQPENRNLDQFIAWIPLADALLPSVALARVQVALYQAKQATAQSLCSGQWMANGPLYDQQAPSLQQTAGPAGELAWFYSALRHPTPVPCARISRVRFFREMSRHLPDWIVVRPAGHKTAFRRGGAVFTDQQHLLANR